MEKPDFSGDALMSAVYQGNFEVVKALLAQGADVNAKNKGGWTALMAASDTNSLFKL